MLHGFLLRCHPREGRFNGDLGPEGRRADGHHCTVLTAGPVDPDAVLARYLAGHRADSPTVPSAVAIWDDREHTLQLIRDRTGLYPLFFARAGEDLVAGPDGRAVLASQGVSNELDPLALAAWLAGIDGEPEATLYGRLKRVPAGHALLAGDRTARVQRLWEPPPEGSSAASEAARFGEVLEGAIARDVDARPGVFLSGGIDSTSVAAAAAAAARRAGLPAPLALCVDIEGASERASQELVAHAVGLERLTRTASAGQRLLARAVARAAESLWPTGSAWQPVFDDLAADARRSGSSTILDGLGGDDLLDAALRPARPALRRGHVRVLRDLAAAERAYTGAGTLSVLKSLVPRRKRQAIPSFVAEHHRAALAELAAQRRDDLLSTRLTAGWEESWDAGKRQGIAYRHPLWDASVVELIRGLPVRALVANGSHKSPARAYLRRAVPAVPGPWPRPAVANVLLQRLEAEHSAALGGEPDLSELVRLGVIEPASTKEGFPLSLFAAMLQCEGWIRSSSGGLRKSDGR